MEQTVAVADIPWNGSLTIVQRKHVRWEISVRGGFRNKEDKSEVEMDASFHYLRWVVNL